MLRQIQLRWSDHLVLMDDEQLPKRLFYGDVATGSRRQGRPIRRYKDTLKSSLKRLQINPTNWKELALDRPTWMRTVKTGAAIYEANRIADVNVKREARKSQVRPVRNADAQRSQRVLETNGHCGLESDLFDIFGSNAPLELHQPSSSEPPLPSSSSYSSSSSSSSFFTAPTAAAQTAVSHITNPDTTTDTTPTASDSSDEDQDYTCPHCDRTFTSHIGLVGHLRIHRTETGEPVPGAPTYTHRTRLQCTHCPRTFTHRMGLFGRMRIHASETDRSTDSSIMSNPTPLHHPAPPPPLPQLTPTPPTSPAHTVPVHSPLALTWHRMGLFGHMRTHGNGIDRSPDTPTTSNTSSAPIPTLALSSCAPITPTTTTTTTTTTNTTASSVDDIDTADFSCPHCPRTFTSHIGLVGHLRIHRTETGEPVPAAPTYTHQARLKCPHCPRIFRPRMGLFGHMRIHDDLW
ncbi:hypothetical protein SprV_0100138000 [Sparganum proliferum]